MTDELKHLTAGEIAGARITEAPLSGQAIRGYGRKIPTGYMLQSYGPGPVWRRVYVVNYGNAGSAYVLVGGKMHFLSPGAELILETIRDGGTLETAREKMAGWPEWMKVAEGLQVPRPGRYDVWTFEHRAGAKPPAVIVGGLARHEIANFFPPGDVDALDTALAAVDAGAAHYSFTDVTGHYSQIRPAAPKTEG